jgi:hypothetical protein
LVSSYSQHAFLNTTDAEAVRLPLIDLNEFVGANSGLVLKGALEINEQEQIVGQGVLSNALVGYRLTPPANNQSAVA